MIWLIEEQLAYALGASVGDRRVMEQAEGLARARFIGCAAALSWSGWLIFQRI